MLADSKIQAKYKNKMSYHLMICFQKYNYEELFHVNKTTNVFFMIFRDFLLTKYHKSLSSVSRKITHKQDSMFTLACKQVLHFRVRKCQPIKTFTRLFSHVKKIVRPIKTLIRQISHVKNIVCSEIRILFQPNTTRKSLYSYNKVPYYGFSIYF